MRLVCGHLVYFDDQNRLVDITRGAIAFEAGKIVDRGDASELTSRYPDASVDDHGQSWILPGFIDAHVHYPQLGVIASYGRQLLDWLNDYTFPEEAKFADQAYSARQSELFIDQMLGNGTTSAAVFATVHSHSADALFSAAQAKNIRLMTGKVMMDRHAPPSLCDTAQSSYDDSECLIKRWHGLGRLEYAITPRFAPTSTPSQLDVCRALWDAQPSLALQTHLSENPDEIEWVKSLFPNAPDYLGVYQHYDLVRPRTLLGHAIHLTDREIDCAREHQATLVHCPTSNLFLGSGLFEFESLAEQGQQIALASDVGGGTSLSMFATMKAAYQVSALSRRPVPIQSLWYAATLGAARSLGWDAVGNLAVGMEADAIVVNPSVHPMLAQRLDRSQSLYEALFAMAILGDDRIVTSTYISGQPAI